MSNISSRSPDRVLVVIFIRLFVRSKVGYRVFLIRKNLESRSMSIIVCLAYYIFENVLSARTVFIYFFKIKVFVFLSHSAVFSLILNPDGACKITCFFLF